MKRFAIFVSGNGTNMENIVKAVQEEKINGAEVGFIFSDKEDAYALTRAQNLSVKAISFSPKKFSDKAEYEEELLRILREEKINFIILAGYMRIVGKTLLEAYPNKILNVHPALLPAFPGKDGIGDAYRAGAKETGVTVHFVDEGIDTGPIILQQATKVEEGESLESLEERIHQIEYQLYPQAIQMMINGEI